MGKYTWFTCPTCYCYQQNSTGHTMDMRGMYGFINKNYGIEQEMEFHADAITSKCCRRQYIISD